MSSEGHFEDIESSRPPSSDDEAHGRSQTSSRRQSRDLGTPRKRRRIESVEPSRVRKYYLEGKYNDAYRVLFNEHVSRVAARFEPSEGVQHYSTQYGASTWSGEEHAMLFAALERLGRDDVPGIAQAIGTKSIPETRELLLLLDDAASKQQDLGLTLRDVPAAIEVGQACTQELDVLAEALAWYQEQFEVTQEQERYGDYWLITPAIAEDVESAINGPLSRAASTRPTTPAEPGTPRTGPGIAGACIRCKYHKIRCDRNVPCGNCARLKKKVVCEYKVVSADATVQDAQSPHPALQMAKLEEEQHGAAQPSDAAVPSILQDIPQAGLLHAENMLLLSMNVFMNRSPDIPSPWPHWSDYASEQVPEPSLLRTAFNDFHTLAVSVTKRLIQTAIMQATSRLRSQRRRTKKGVLPFVKTRDVLSAIDILGLKRNGRQRWAGVAKRCNLRVFDEQRTTRFKVKQREISWDEAERILNLYDAVVAPYVGEMEPAEPRLIADENAFHRRAARSGTPLPTDTLSLSDSDSDARPEDNEADDRLASDDMKSNDPLHTQPTRDRIGRYTSIAPEEASRPHKVQTLEQFDQDASRQEEAVLCGLLDLAASKKKESPSDDESKIDDDVEFENLTTNIDRWRSWTEYHAVWEEHENPITAANFIVNQKPRNTTTAAHRRQLRNAEFESADDSNTSIASRSPLRSRQDRTGVVELRTRDPRAYAAMQNIKFDEVGGFSGSDMSDSVGGVDADADADVPAQSVENTAIVTVPGSDDAID